MPLSFFQDKAIITLTLFSTLGLASWGVNENSIPVIEQKGKIATITNSDIEMGSVKALKIEGVNQMEGLYKAVTKATNFHSPQGCIVLSPYPDRIGSSQIKTDNSQETTPQCSAFANLKAYFPSVTKLAEYQSIILELEGEKILQTFYTDYEGNPFTLTSYGMIEGKIKIPEHGRFIPRIKIIEQLYGGKTTIIDEIEGEAIYISDDLGTTIAAEEIISTIHDIQSNTQNLLYNSWVNPTKVESGDKYHIDYSQYYGYVQYGINNDAAHHYESYTPNIDNSFLSVIEKLPIEDQFRVWHLYDISGLVETYDNKGDYLSGSPILIENFNALFQIQNTYTRIYTNAISGCSISTKEIPQVSVNDYSFSYPDKNITLPNLPHDALGEGFCTTEITIYKNYQPKKTLSLHYQRDTSGDIVVLSIQDIQVINTGSNTEKNTLLNLTDTRAVIIDYMDQITKTSEDIESAQRILKSGKARVLPRD